MEIDLQNSGWVTGRGSWKNKQIVNGKLSFSFNMF